MKIIGFVNQKGGVGKTTSANAFAYGLAKKGKRVLAIDFDPQGNLSYSMDVDTQNKPSVYEWLKGEATFEEILTECKGIDLLPSDIRLVSLGYELINSMKREEKLIRGLAKAKIDEKYDYVIIDSSPSLGLLTTNVLCACDEVIVTMSPEMFSLEAFKVLLKIVKEIVEGEINPELKINGILLTMVDSKRKSTQQIIDYVKEVYANIKLYDARIRYSVVAPDAAGSGINIYDFKKDSGAKYDYLEFVSEFLEDERITEK